MTTIRVVTRDGEERRIPATDGSSLMLAIRGASIDELHAICGGACSCATCHVWVDAEWIEAAGPPNEVEDALLDGSLYREEGSRLSCQITVQPALDDMRVTIAPED